MTVCVRPPIPGEKMILTPAQLRCLLWSALAVLAFALPAQAQSVQSAGAKTDAARASQSLAAAKAAARADDRDDDLQRLRRGRAAG